MEGSADMIRKLLGFIVSDTLRYQMTIVYATIYVLLSLAGKMDAVAFATFSGVIGVWIIGETVRKAK